MTPAVGIALAAVVASRASGDVHSAIPLYLDSTIRASVSPTDIPDLDLTSRHSQLRLIRPAAPPRPSVVAAPTTPASPRRLRPRQLLSRSIPTLVPVVTGGFRERVLTVARTVLGTPYAWGKESPTDGFDCSGLTMFVYGRAGVTLPRVADAQMRALKSVRSPQPGDLVFFLDAAGYAYHVGIYVSPGQMIAAPKTGDHVRVEKIWTSQVAYRAAA